MKKRFMFTVLLYYKYVKIENPKEIVENQKRMCRELGIKGRILISEEGINGTCAGTREAIEKYIAETEKIPEFSDIDWKFSESDFDPFPRLRVAYRSEIVTFGLKKERWDVNLDEKAAYISPEELKEKIENGEEIYLVDARNGYETRVGMFGGAIDLGIQNFRDLPDAMERISHLKDRQVITYCTGGIRCEKTSAYLRQNGFTNVRQLLGGIHRYGEKVGGKYFDGEMYVFDGRITIPVNTVDPEIISHCHFCQEKTARYTNCVNVACNLHFICCENCEDESEGACSDVCKSAERKRERVSYSRA